MKSASGGTRTPKGYARHTLNVVRQPVPPRSRFSRIAQARFASLIAVGVRLRVAVRAEEAEVLSTVIVVDTVDVIQVQYQRFSSPLDDAAHRAAVLDPAKREESTHKCRTA